MTDDIDDPFDAYTVVVNDEALSRKGSSRPLADGDRVELGEVILRFHAR